MLSPIATPLGYPIGTGAPDISFHSLVAGSNAAPSVRGPSSGSTQSAVGGHGSASVPPTTYRTPSTANAFAERRADNGPSGNLVQRPPSGFLGAAPGSIVGSAHARATSRHTLRSRIAVLMNLRLTRGARCSRLCVGAHESEDFTRLVAL